MALNQLLHLFCAPDGKIIQLNHFAKIIFAPDLHQSVFDLFPKLNTHNLEQIELNPVQLQYKNSFYDLSVEKVPDSPLFLLSFIPLPPILTQPQPVNNDGMIASLATNNEPTPFLENSIQSFRTVDQLSTFAMNTNSLPTNLQQAIAEKKHLQKKLNQAKKEIEKLYQRQAALEKLELAINQSNELTQLLNEIVHSATQLLPATGGASIIMWDKENQHVVTGATSVPTQVASNVAREIRKNGATHWIITHLEPVVVSDIYQDPFTANPMLAEHDLKSYVGVPILVEKEVLGVMYALNRESREYSNDDVKFIELLANRAASSIIKVYQFDKERQQRELAEKLKEEIQLAYDATIEGWSYALELRDKETRGHTERVTQMTLRLARKIGITNSEKLTHIRRGSLLHDIGKISIPDSILMKPDKLTNYEIKIMQKHALYAYEMLSPIKYLEPALEIPYCHHEKWDGTGYPRGLKGEEIPLSARIFAVVDVWDALLSKRVYHDPWTTQSVREYIASKAGSHFDPVIVEAFLELDW